MLCVDPGNIADRGHEEFYTSAPFQLPEGRRATRIFWEAETPARTWVKAQLRSSSARETLEEATWLGPHGGEENWFEDGDPVDPVPARERWIQYRLALGAFNSGSTPRIKAVHVEYD